jgi:uncharacterized protein
MPFLTIKGDGSLLLCIYVQPRASRTGLCGIHGDSLKVAIAAPPVDGKANREIITYLSTLLKIPKKEITIISGAQSRKKKCRISSLTESEVRKRIALVLGGLG